MDIKKEREAFEAVTNIYHCIYNADLNYYFSGSQFVGNKAEIAVNAGWKAWQAAKAQQKTPQFNLDEFLIMEENLKHKGGVITADLDRFIAYAEMVLEKAKALKEPK